MKIKFAVLGKAVSMNRMWRNGRNGFYKAQEANDWQELVEWNAVMEAKKHKVDTKAFYHVHIDYYFNDKRRRDAHNCDKLIFDAMEGVFYDDDSQIWSWSGRRHIGEPKIKVTLETIER